ncbi:MFS transporter [Microbacterium sp. ARD32]|uniref:MFS transporter n=1 Tax=Microbacterium sp. ARD32 TaxID=2962577 RepID=UPI0028816170|nr:MFS transporter [Microbacterium sp. ARD32]MDT0158519.1 MFS transporter [Microbacterium sp. ARD32]
MSAAAVLPLAIFWSTIDRSLILPLIPQLAEDLDAPLAVAANAVTLHALAYALLQVMWGPLSTRWGRIRVLTVSTALAAVANLLVALSPDIVVLLIARTASGGAFAAMFAAVLTYFGDTLPLERRPAAMANLATATALGLAAGTVIAGAATQWVSWQVLFVVYAVVTALLAVLIAVLPEARDDGAAPLRMQLRQLMRNRWALVVCAVTGLEGVLLIGLYNMLPVALQQAGGGAAVSGFVTAAFGVAVVVVSQLMKLVVHRVAPLWFLVAGGGCAVLAFVLLATQITPLSVLVGATGMGAGWALAHTTLQTWMTDAAAQTRALGMTMFSISLMLGGSLGALAGAAAVAAESFPLLFAAAALASAVFGGTAALGRLRYRVRGD